MSFIYNRRRTLLVGRKADETSRIATWQHLSIEFASFLVSPKPKVDSLEVSGV
jgi:hypothetical protein